MKTLTIIIPLFNEAERVQKTLEKLVVYKPPANIAVEKIIFINDGSSDNTLSVLHHWRYKFNKIKNKNFHPAIEIFSYKRNRGRGFAVRRGFKNVDTDYAVYIDGDLSIPLCNLIKFSKYMEKDYDLLIGSKKMPGAVCLNGRGIIRTIVGYGHSFLAALILGIWCWDFQGGFKMFSRRFIKEVIPFSRFNHWGFDMEVIFLGKNMGYLTLELPVVWQGVIKGSKVKLLRDIERALRDMVRIRINWMTRKIASQIPAFRLSFYIPVEKQGNNI